MNIFDQVSLHTWIDLRKLSIDYGKKYFARHEIFMPVIFQLGLTCMFFLFLILSQIVPLGSSEDAQVEKKKLIIGLTCGIGYLFGLLFWMLYSAAQINKQFELHMQILKLNKDLLDDIFIFKEYYFAEKMNPELIAQNQKGS